MIFNLENKTALVTGATGGIGEAIARALHKQGAHVILSGRREEKLAQLKEDLGNNASTLKADLSQLDSIEAIAKEAEALNGQVDVLVNNAGIAENNLLLRIKKEDWHRVIDTNLTSAFLLSKTLLRGMIKRRWGRIINISSVVAFMGNAGQSHYVTSKAGMVGMTKAFAHESATRGITANCIAPGYIKTDMTEDLSDEIKTKMQEKIPCQRLGIPDDIAYSCVYLSSNEASYVTGQTVHVNGGMVML